MKGITCIFFTVSLSFVMLINSCSTIDQTSGLGTQELDILNDFEIIADQAEYLTEYINSEKNVLRDTFIYESITILGIYIEKVGKDQATVLIVSRRSNNPNLVYSMQLRRQILQSGNRQLQCIRYRKSSLDPSAIFDQNKEIENIPYYFKEGKSIESIDTKVTEMKLLMEEIKGLVNYLRYQGR
ncbi:MAG: hypothetical protein ACI83D_000104 [Planctomycetota bacterium]|jgi:hypothetical protein